MKLLLIALLSLSSLSSFASNLYSCSVIGQYKNLDGVTVNVRALNILVNVNARGTQFGRQVQPEHDRDNRPQAMPWTISIVTRRDGAHLPLILTLNAPNQNGSVAYAYSETGSKYIGFNYNGSLEALCVKK